MSKILFMSTFLDKSRRNIETAKILLDNGFFIPSVHPAYYGAFLIAKCLLDNKKVMSFSEQEKKTKGKDSHNIIQKAVFPLLKQSSPDYMVEFMKLKQMRKKADYTTEEIAQESISDNFKIASCFVENIAKLLS